MDDAVNEKLDRSSSHKIEVKYEAIQQACRDHNIAELVSLASSTGGLLEDDLRKSACECNWSSGL